VRVHNGVTRTCSHAISPSSPRNAGTHNHRAALLKHAGAAGTPNNIFLWIWVPGRASLARDEKERIVVPFGPIRFSNSHALPRHRPACRPPCAARPAMRSIVRRRRVAPPHHEGLISYRVFRPHPEEPRSGVSMDGPRQDWSRDFAFSRRVASEFCNRITLIKQQRAQGRPGVG
jgi:hypothetical protein